MGRLPLTEEVGVVPLDGGVALLDDLESGRLQGVAPLGGVIGGVVVSPGPLKWGFLGGLSGGSSGWIVCQIGVPLLLDELVPLFRI